MVYVPQAEIIVQLCKILGLNHFRHIFVQSLFTLYDRTILNSNNEIVMASKENSERSIGTYIDSILATYMQTLP